MLRYVRQLNDNHVLVKLDFNNAFNSIRRDLVLDSTADKTPELYRFVYASSPCNPILTFDDKQILSREGFQQGDPLSSSGFCDAVHPTLTSLGSTLRLGFIDDFFLSGEVRTVADDVERMIQAAEKTDLTLNESKCEIIASNFDIIENIDTFRDFRRVAPQYMTLLGAPVLKCSAVD